MMQLSSLVSSGFNVMALVHWLEMNGDSHPSRIGPTHEVLGTTVSINHTSVPYRRGMVRRLGVVEALQFLSGYFDERHIFKVVPNLHYHYGIANAYGIKVAQQLPKVLDQLTNNPESRRATIHIGKPEDGQETTKPCMQEMQFQIRQNHLFTSVFARSWDAINGLPYDLTMFNLVSQVVANYLNVKPGKTFVFASSLHYYDNDLAALVERYGEDDILASDQNPPWTGIFVDRQFRELDEIRDWAIDSLNSMDSWIKGLPEGMYSNG